MLDNQSDRVGVLRRKIAALETLAMDPGTSLPESESAQTTANKLRLELSRLVRDGATRVGWDAPEATGAEAPPPPFDAATHAAGAAKTARPVTRDGRRTSRAPAPRAMPSNPRAWSAETPIDATAPKRSPVKPAVAPVVVPRWLQRLAPVAALAALAGAYVWWPEQPSADAGGSAALAAPEPAEIKPRLSYDVPTNRQSCKSAEDSVQAAANALLGRRRDGVMLTAANVDGCTGRFESRLVSVGKRRGTKKLDRGQLSSEIVSTLCADATIRAALIDHAASYTFGYYDSHGKWLEDLTVDASSCTRKPERAPRH